MRVCRKCGKEKMIEDFHPHISGKRYECKECLNFRQQLNTYKLSKEDYFEMLNGQKEVCALCKERKKLCIDHNHTTGKVRGLLCYKCNLLIANLETNKHLLQEANIYLWNGQH